MFATMMFFFDEFIKSSLVGTILDPTSTSSLQKEPAVAITETAGLVGASSPTLLRKDGM